MSDRRLFWIIAIGSYSLFWIGFKSWYTLCWCNISCLVRFKLQRWFRITAALIVYAWVGLREVSWSTWVENSGAVIVTAYGVRFLTIFLHREELLMAQLELVMIALLHPKGQTCPFSLSIWGCWCRVARHVSASMWAKISRTVTEGVDNLAFSEGHVVAYRAIMSILRLSRPHSICPLVGRHIRTHIKIFVHHRKLRCLFFTSLRTNRSGLER